MGVLFSFVVVFEGARWRILDNSSQEKTNARFILKVENRDDDVLASLAAGSHIREACRKCYKNKLKIIGNEK